MNHLLCLIPPGLLLTVLIPICGRAATIDHIQGEMVGEVSSTSAILQSRLTGTEVDAQGDVPGVAGVARFEYAASLDFEDSRTTSWISAAADQDYTVKVKVDGLDPATKYYYRLEFGIDQRNTRRGPVRSFRTHLMKDQLGRHSFVVVTGMNFHYFHHGGGRRQPYAGPDKMLGYPALNSMTQLAPDFFVGTGDNVYYDAPRATSATDEAAMRKKWHEQLVQPRFVELFANVPTYWEKDDHDYRYNDCDNTPDKLPDVETGLRIFREQVPVTDPQDPAAVTYRTYQCGKLLQLWFPEIRDYRSPNRAKDDASKTLWGPLQREWLKRTLLESPATFKVIISPTPMVGPDDLRKKDNHCDVDGFRYEGDEFFAWAKEHGFLDRGLFIVCGDRHWQYHSIHPTGFEEFSTGALVDANSRLGVKPGDAKGTDPNAKIQQPYTSSEPSGGFLQVVVEPHEEQSRATLQFRFLDENGVRLHTVSKSRGWGG